MWISFADGLPYGGEYSWSEGRCYGTPAINVEFQNPCKQIICSLTLLVAYGPYTSLVLSWSHIARFPMHHENIPPNFETEFTRVLNSYGNGAFSQ